MPDSDDKQDTPKAGSYIVAVLIPIVGVVLAVRQFARNNIGPGFALLVTSVAVGAAWLVLIGSTGSNARCVITAQGQKLCGDDASAWCDATDSLRDISRDSESQAVCDDIRAR